MVDVVELPLNVVAVNVFVFGLYVNGVVVSSINNWLEALSGVFINGIKNFDLNHRLLMSYYSL